MPVQAAVDLNFYCLAGPMSCTAGQSPNQSPVKLRRQPITIAADAIDGASVESKISIE
jgi:hypothetical protein